MEKRKWQGSVIFAVMVIATAGLLPISGFADDDDDDDDEHFWSRSSTASQTVQIESSNIYNEECGSCHFAFPPVLLPKIAWQEIMNNLSDHFDDNAELSAETQREITDYLVNNSADTLSTKTSRKTMRSVNKGKPTMRITELAYFRHEHNEIPKRIFENNPELSGITNCDACHTKAQNGSFRESDIHIPGIGRWDD